jgi:hypothetical protein
MSYPSWLRFAVCCLQHAALASAEWLDPARFDRARNQGLPHIT